MRTTKAFSKYSPYQPDSSFNLIQDMFDLTLSHRKFSITNDAEIGATPA